MGSGMDKNTHLYMRGTGNCFAPIFSIFRFIIPSFSTIKTIKKSGWKTLMNKVLFHELAYHASKLINNKIVIGQDPL